MLGCRFEEWYISVHSFRTGATVLLTQDEAQRLLAPHLEPVASWHRIAYKQQLELRADVPDRWADLEASTQGQVVHDLIVARAQEDETEGRRFKKDGTARVIEVADSDGLAALLRFRRVKFVRRHAGEGLRPAITSPLSPTARDWVGNDHLKYAWQHSLLETPTQRLHTNLVVGHTADPDTAELDRVVVLCVLGSQLQWWFDAQADAAVLSLSRPAAPSRRDLRIIAKAQDREDRSQ
jgi:hypothetical protein